MRGRVHGWCEIFNEKGGKMQAAPLCRGQWSRAGTQAVSFIEVAKVNIHAALVRVASGQLPFLVFNCVNIRWYNDTHLA
jgi:hypothetical protein